MVKFEFYLPGEDLDRIFAIKKIQGKDDLTGNEFAAELLHKTLADLFPSAPEFDGAGNITNGNKYTGSR